MRLTIRRKLLIVILLPLTLALVLGLVYIQSQVKELIEISEAQNHLEKILSLSDLVSSFQSERGLAYLYLTGTCTENMYTSVCDFTDTNWELIYSKFDKKNLGQLYDRLKSLQEKQLEDRKKVKEKKMTDDGAYSEYCSLVDKLFSNIEQLSQSSNSDVNEYFNLLFRYEKARECTSRIQALTSSIYSKDRVLLYQDMENLLEEYSGIVTNLSTKGKFGKERSDAFMMTLSRNNEWATLQQSVLNIMQNSLRGHYGRGAYQHYQTTSLVVVNIASLISETSNEASQWFENQVIVVTRYLILTVSAITISILVVIIFSWLISTRLIKGIKGIASQMEEIASGDADLTKTLSIKTHDELGDLVKAFNEFMTMLRKLIDGVKQETKSINDSVINLSSNTEQTASSVRQIAANIESVKNQTTKQSASVSESSAAVEQITKNINILNGLINKQSESVTTSSSSIEEMVANIHSVSHNVDSMADYYKQLLSKSGEGQTTIDTVVKQVQEISLQSEKLQEANTLISGIASQTNLLAMNAAIEAAHAGVAGQGFAVVADEIRKLAENSSNQSKQINKTIKEIKSVISAVVSSSKISSKTFVDILEHIQTLSRLEAEVSAAMQEQNAGSNLILESLSNINGITVEVRESAKMMNDGSSVVMEEIRHLLQVTSELENGMVEMSTGATEIQSAAQNTSKLSFNVQDSVKKLAKDTNKFST